MLHIVMLKATIFTRRRSQPPTALSVRPHIPQHGAEALNSMSRPQDSQVQINIYVTPTEAFRVLLRAWRPWVLGFSGSLATGIGTVGHLQLG